MIELTDRIEEITNEAGGTWGIALYDMDTGISWEKNSHDTFYAASVIKVPIMIAAFAASQKGELSLSEQLELKREDIVGGSGVLQHLTPGYSFSIYDLITLMIIQSDNTATNMLINYIGVAEIQQSMREIGMEKSRFCHRLMTLEVDREGQNEINAYEMTEMLVKLASGKIISAHASEQMITIMKKQQIRNALPSNIPTQNDKFIGMIKKWEFANKTGNIPGISHDIGMLYVGNRIFIASVLSKGVEDIEAPKIIGNIGLEIYQYLIKNRNAS
ncbi:serine hydrolase [Ornithinibacillus scapharcae]|uniref:serine hydrolase n=1 Tax=Ornithinibacillus scapharcae TaxID=1147159 RepID=UPI000225AB98|nr:serine hydrolase [Ornithinibacillus scapharcae]